MIIKSDSVDIKNDKYFIRKKKKKRNNGRRNGDLSHLVQVCSRDRKKRGREASIRKARRSESDNPMHYLEISWRHLKRSSSIVGT